MSHYDVFLYRHRKSIYDGKVVTEMERHCTCINGHSFTGVGMGDEPDQAKETYVIRPCPVCEVPTEIKWPLNRALEAIAK